jgi:phosphoribosylamine--glycine ligase
MPEGDTGPNTGGMGAYTPAPVVPPEMEQTIMRDVILPTVKGMAAEGCPFQGVLFAGIMIQNGKPRLLEYNVRFGDPECQTLMMRLQSDLLPLLEAAADGTLADAEAPTWSDETALLVVYATEGYPGSYAKGSVISNLDAANAKVPLSFDPSPSLPRVFVLRWHVRVCGAAPPAFWAAKANRRSLRCNVFSVLLRRR